MKCVQIASISSGGSVAGALFKIDPGADTTLGTALVNCPPSNAPHNLAKSRVFNNCLGFFGAATHVVVEFNYFDMDSRSNAKATVDLRHSPVLPTADRLVFLTAPGDSEASGKLSDVLELVDSCTVVGYMIIVPDTTGPVGRSIIPLPVTIDGALPEDKELGRQVRTPVAEHITLFGKRHRVVGVPFMQQDGNVLTCSHVAAWMVHYAAVLRGLVARRPSIAFHIEPTEGLVRGRAFPSPGLTSSQVAVTLGRFGLATDDLTMVELDVGGRLASWYDREAVWGATTAFREAAGGDTASYVVYDRRLDQRIKQVDWDMQASLAKYRGLRESAPEEAPPEEFDRLNAEIIRLEGELEYLTQVEDHVGRFWIRETFTRTACQLLNSGFPVILLHKGHAQVIVGYMRRDECEPVEVTFGNSEYSSPSDVVAFIAADDQIGPFNLLKVDELLETIARNSSSTHLMLPLPRGIWVSGTDAEEVGARLFEGGLRQCVGDLSTRLEERVVSHTTEEDVALISDKLSGLLDEIAQGKTAPADLSLRGYLTLSTDYKRSFQERCGDVFAQKQIRVASLPKWVWVVEVLRRSERKEHRPCVIGEVILDATETDPREAVAYALHLPGVMQVRGHQGEGRWHASGYIDLYDSGRHHGKSESPDDGEALLTRFPKALA